MAASSFSASPGLLAFATITSILGFILYRAFFDPLRAIPGPFVCRLTSFWTWYHCYFGDDATQTEKLHRKYGPVVRIAPNEISIADGAALVPIYSEKGGFLKAPCYTNFDFEGHSTIFSTLDPSHRAIRSKAVLPLFSMGNIRAGTETIEECVSKLVSRMKDEAAESREAGKKTGQPKPVNLLNLSRSLALDAVSSYLFNTHFGGIGEKTEKMSASAFVDSTVALNRWFYLPNWLFRTLEKMQLTFMPVKEEGESADKVGDFVSSFLDASEKGEVTTYHGRLQKIGLSRHETEVQCKDLIFAGTDSTGMNLSTICWNLAKWPDVYAKLREEIAEADRDDPSYNPQSLRYLDAVVREGLRTSMANPSRFPRVVPPQGFSFMASDKKTYFFPPGTMVGLQPMTLHFNPSVFPDPHAFKPERWFDATPEMQRDYIPFGLGPRQCIARNLATVELLLATRAIAREGVLEGAQTVGDEVEIYEWFNSKVKGEKMELVWR